MAIETVQIKTATGAYAYIAGDLIGTQFFPYTKLDMGSDGVSSPVVGSVPVTMSAAIPAGTANIGDVDVLSIPSTASSSAYQASQQAFLSTIATNTGQPIVQRQGVAGAYQPGFAMFGIRDDVLTSIAGEAAEGGYVLLRLDANGALHTIQDGAISASIDTINVDRPTAQIWKSYNSTASIAAGAAATIWTPASAKKIRLDKITISTYGTVGARIFLFFAASGDLTYNAGTDQPAFVGSFAPSATSKPGVDLIFNPPITCDNANYYLKYQNDAAISVDITAYGCEI